MTRTRLLAVELDRRDCPAVFGNPWLDPNITLSFVPDGTPVNGLPSQFDAALATVPARRLEVLRAFQAWVAVASVNVGVVPDGGQPVGAAGTAFNDPRFGDVRVSAVPLPADNVALALPFDLTAGTRAGDVMFNSDLPFRAGTPGGFDLFSVALHEAGHVFGVPPSADPASAMFQVADRVRTGLAAADVQAVQQLYGPRQPDRYEGPAGNETVETAARLQSSGDDDDEAAITTARGDLTTAADADVYEFAADDDAALVVTFRTAGVSLLVAAVEILDEAGQVLAAGAGADPGSGDVAFRLTNLDDDARYFLRVRAAGPTFAVGGYEVELRTEGDDDDGLDDSEVGGDDSPETSGSPGRLPNLGGPRQNFFVASSLSTAADVDFYRVRAAGQSGTSAGPLTVSVVATGGAATDPVVEVLDEVGVRQAVTVLTHDAGEFTAQLADAAANRDYFVVVRHGPRSAAAAGNYSLGIDFGGPRVPLQTYAAGVLTAAAPANTVALTVPAGQVLHLILTLDPTPTPAAARLSVFDAANRPVDSRLANANETASVNVLLAPGTYTLLVGGGATAGGPMPAIAYRVLGLTLSDPIGPVAVQPGTQIPFVPPPPPPATPGPTRPATPTTPVTPTDPNFLLTPPTDQPTAPTLRLRPVSPPPARTFSVGLPTDNGSAIRSFEPNGTERFAVVPFATYTGSLRTAEADVTGDGVADVLVGTGPGAASRVQLLDGRTQAVLFDLAPFEPAFTGGVFVATGDLSGDGVADLVITPDRGGGPRVRVFNGVGFAQAMDFFGIDDSNFRGGARATVGDVNADGTGDLIVAAGFRGGPRVAGYDGAALTRGTVARVFGDFFAFEQTLRNGVYVTAADLDGDGFAEVIAGGGPGGGPRVQVLSGRDLLSNRYTVVANFFAGDPAARDGVRVAAKTLTDDGRADLVVGVGRQVIGYSGVSFSPLGPPAVVLNETVPADAGGVFVG